eukprot:SAG11_NODE_540_length_8654_cov_9.626110_1_plen_74_part_00
MQAQVANGDVMSGSSEIWTEDKADEVPDEAELDLATQLAELQSLHDVWQSIPQNANAPCTDIMFYASYSTTGA